MKKILFLFALLVFASAGSAALAQDAPKGNAEAAKNGKIAMCTGCHGVPYYKTVFPDVYHVPMISGQSELYIVKALQAYKSGDRNHPSMRGIARSLSDQDMADLAAYYTAHKN